MSVILINPFEVPPGKEEDALALLRRIAAIDKQNSSSHMAFFG